MVVSAFGANPYASSAEETEGRTEGKWEAVGQPGAVVEMVEVARNYEDRSRYSRNLARNGSGSAGEPERVFRQCWGRSGC